ncbi:helix-turn-helix domain-containing protein [Motilimonas sp. E26]|nr:helix-turn-helix domain-containing protein [Motilimonas sp. E26]
MLTNKGRFYSKEELALIGWPNKLVSKNSVPVAIVNIRKIFKSHTKLEIIANEKNKGYTALTDKVKFVEANFSVKPIENVHQQELINHEPEKRLSSDKEIEPAHAPNYKYKLAKLKRIALIGLGYPLLIANVSILFFLIFSEKATLKQPVVDVVNNKKHIAVYNSYNRDFALLINSAIDKDITTLKISELKKTIDRAMFNDKSIVFINTLSSGVTVDCLQKKELFSFSGDNLEAIIENLKLKGCKI